MKEWKRTGVEGYLYSVEVGGKRWSAMIHPHMPSRSFYQFAHDVTRIDSRFRRGAPALSQVRGAHPLPVSAVSEKNRERDALTSRVPRHATAAAAFERRGVCVRDSDSRAVLRLALAGDAPTRPCTRLGRYGWFLRQVAFGRGRLGRPGVNGLATESFGGFKALLARAFLFVSRKEIPWRLARDCCV